MKYQIVKESNQEVFEEVVNYLLSDGWSLQGGASIAVNSQSNNTYFVQALVKETK